MIYILILTYRGARNEAGHHYMFFVCIAHRLTLGPILVAVRHENKSYAQVFKWGLSTVTKQSIPCQLPQLTKFDECKFRR